ncbi:MAG: Exodeoxyribonuclease small subunit [Mahella sp.]|nr:Exodeoxyribonuclease small subunit [Mahella sp.]MDK2903079.1 exodeoxyribonuclease small subunit [Clostridiales bacterium]MDK2991330.1 exodeoxyribonuclease small subunit [Clostridiales bacterium]
MIEDDMTFEKAIRELENIVTSLENGDVALDQAIALFERGMELSRYCSQKLDEAEGKITMLMKEQNAFKEVPFN